ncbi:MAG: hypothetical protein FWD17_15300, partial [Polyangiaceae bacterium]|nr:hypothetical protein [Polyangiaceae bacterium]
MNEGPYREPLPVPPDPYLTAWADLRRRRRWARVNYGIAGAAPMFRYLFPPDSHWLGYALALVLMLPFELMVREFHCPHCAGPMLSFWRWRAEDWKRCRHC